MITFHFLETLIFMHKVRARDLNEQVDKLRDLLQ